MSARHVLAGLLLTSAVPAAAQDDARTFQPPQGCTAHLTVQNADCTVAHHFTCEADPDGWQRFADMDEGGISVFGTIDREAQWIEHHFVDSAHAERLAPAPRDPASLSKLMATGRDAYDFETLSDEIGPTRYVGEDRLTGETVTIDGVPLDRTEYEITAFDAAGGEVWRETGRQFISRDWRIFLGGPGTSVAGGEVTERNDAPVEFLTPGEPGFLGVSPRHGCGKLMSKGVA